jgi:threonine dehydratase
MFWSVNILSLINQKGKRAILIKMSEALVTYEQIVAAERLLCSRLKPTPMVECARISRRLGTSIRFKAEHLQKTGSFKVRGMLHCLLTSSAQQREAGFITVSAGNAAAALAYAAGEVGSQATVVMPQTASRSKIEATESYGGRVLLTSGDLLESCAAEQQHSGATFVHPFDDLRLIAGHGSLGLELLRDEPQFSRLIVPVGGGGLISGVAAAIRAERSDVEIIGVEPRGAAVMSASLSAGAVQRLSKIETIADGLAAPFGGEHTLRHIDRLVDRLVLVNEPEIAEATRWLWGRAKWAVEPSAAASLAAAASKALPRTTGLTVAVLSGGNVDPSRICGLFDRA